MSLINTANLEIDEKKLEIMKKRIIDIERQNIKTKAFTENEMLEEIRKIIMEESKKNY